MTFDDAIAHVRAHGSAPARKSEKAVAGVQIIEWHFPAGTVQLSEVHEYDHASFLISGEGVLRANGKETHLKAPCMVEIKAGIEHAFWALTDVVWDCVHALKEHA